MKRLTQKQIKRAARTDRGALNVSIKKYHYLLQLTLIGVKNLPENFLKAEYCGFCQRYARTSKCPFKPGLLCKGQTCLQEWHDMVQAYDELKSTGGILYYREFLDYASLIYAKLMVIKEELK